MTFQSLFSRLRDCFLFAESSEEEGSDDEMIADKESEVSGAGLNLLPFTCNRKGVTVKGSNLHVHLFFPPRKTGTKMKKKRSNLMNKKWLLKRKSMVILIWNQKTKVKKNSDTKEELLTVEMSGPPNSPSGSSCWELPYLHRGTSCVQGHLWGTVHFWIQSV